MKEKKIMSIFFRSKNTYQTQLHESVLTYKAEKHNKNSSHNLPHLWYIYRLRQEILSIIYDKREIIYTFTTN